jgi:hypothetical protein
MKKYLFGILAVALAIGFSAFTKPAKSPIDPKVFELQSQYLLTTTSSDITDRAHWQLMEEQTEIDCPFGEQFKPCQILVDANSVSNDQLTFCVCRVNRKIRFRECSLASCGTTFFYRKIHFFL